MVLVKSATVRCKQPAIQIVYVLRLMASLNYNLFRLRLRNLNDPNTIEVFSNMGRKGDPYDRPTNRKNGKGRARKKTIGGNGNRRQDRANVNSRQDQFMMTGDMMFCQEIGTEDFNGGKKIALKGLKLRMWDFAQCDPKRCTGARLARRGIFQSMPLKQPFKGLVLSPNGSEPVSPADVEILEVHGLSVIDCSWAR